VARIAETKEKRVVVLSLKWNYVLTLLVLLRVPAERLLVFQVQEGWEPLCKVRPDFTSFDTP
jgi:hypothetical protein